MAIKIIDLYSQNAVDFAKLVEEGYRGVIFKAGQGQLADVPRLHPDWWGLAKEYGLDRGWYWLKDARYRPSLEVEAMKAATHLDFGELGLWVDCEKPVLSMTEAQYWMCPYSGFGPIYDFMYGVELQTGKLPGLYTSPGFWKLISAKMPLTSAEWFARAKLWTAQYPWVYVPGVSKPTLYGAWKKWTLWQYREGPDINNYNGTDAEYEAEFGGTPPVTGGEMLFGKVTAQPSLNIRNGAGAGYQIIGSLLPGDIVQGEIVNGWWKLSDATRNGQPVKLTSGVTLKEQAAATGAVYASGSFIVATEPPVVSDVTLKSWQVVVIIDGVEHTFSG